MRIAGHKTFFSYVLLFLSAASCTGSAEASNLLVYNVGFDVDTITGYHESDFPRAGCKGFINDRTFNSLMKRPSRRVSYDRNDVKAMIKARGGRVYFVDYSGVVRSGQNLYLIDKNRFERAIRYASKCE